MAFACSDGMVEVGVVGVDGVMAAEQELRRRALDWIDLAARHVFCLPSVPGRRSANAQITEAETVRVELPVQCTAETQNTSSVFCKPR